MWGDSLSGTIMAEPAIWLAIGLVLVLAALLWRSQRALADLRMAHDGATRDLGHRDETLARQVQLAEDLSSRHDVLQSEHRELSLQLEKSLARLEAREARLAELAEERDSLTDALHQTRNQVSTLERDLASVRLAAEKDQERAAHDLAQLRELREEMTGHFRLMANETLRVQGADMQKTHGEQLNALLTPFREQVQHFQRELRDRNRILDEEGARLRDQIANIGNEASALTRALKGDKQKQGAWGEMILERVLEESGLERSIHYDVQTSWTDEDGKTWRPDVIVRMPQKKLLVVDSKVSLNAYEQAVNAEDDIARSAALKRHVDAMRAHITTLSGKGYDQLAEGAVDYVLMFIPIEGAFSEAMRFDPELASFAMDRRVGLTTPTTLMLTLRTVEHVWTVERRESNALEIARRAGLLYDKMAGFIESLDNVGVAINRASDAHRQAIDRLSRGNGNVIRQVQMLQELGARATKRIQMDHDRETDFQTAALPGPDEAGVQDDEAREVEPTGRDAAE